MYPLHEAVGTGCVRVCWLVRGVVEVGPGVNKPPSSRGSCRTLKKNVGERLQRGSREFPAAGSQTGSGAKSILVNQSRSPESLHMMKVSIAAQACMKDVPTGDAERPMNGRV